jgi:hypothetical protein
LTHHVKAKEFRAPGYSGLPGKEAGAVLNQLFQEVSHPKTSDASISFDGMYDWIKRILNWRRVPDVRLALAAEMEKSVERTPFEVNGSSVSAEKYNLKFKKDGSVEGKSFFVWRLKKINEQLKFVDLQDHLGGE